MEKLEVFGTVLVYQIFGLVIPLEHMIGEKSMEIELLYQRVERLESVCVGDATTKQPPMSLCLQPILFSKIGREKGQRIHLDYGKVRLNSLSVCVGEKGVLQTIPHHMCLYLYVSGSRIRKEKRLALGIIHIYALCCVFIVHLK